MSLVVPITTHRLSALHRFTDTPNRLGSLSWVPAQCSRILPALAANTCVVLDHTVPEAHRLIDRAPGAVTPETKVAEANKVP